MAWLKFSEIEVKRANLSLNLCTASPHIVHRIVSCFTIFTSWRPFSVHSWGATSQIKLPGYHTGDMAALFVFLLQCIDLGNCTMFLYLRTPLSNSHQVEVWWLDVFQQSMCSYMCTNHIGMIAPTAQFLWVGEYWCGSFLTCFIFLWGTQTPIIEVSCSVDRDPNALSICVFIYLQTIDNHNVAVKYS